MNHSHTLAQTQIRVHTYAHACIHTHTRAPGFFFGRTPLIKLSPKKTWEGFIGGAVGTVILAYVLSLLLAKHKWMICPRRVSNEDLSTQSE